MSRRGVFDRIMNKEEYMQPEQKAVPIKLSDSTTQDPDELVECPYDKIHRIRVSRFPMHLLKCRKNYTGREMFTCPFNARHIVPKPEARHHVANCPDKAAIEKEMLQGFESNNTYCKGYIKVPSYHKNDVYHPPTENWDDEISRTRNTEQEYWGPDDGTGDESGRHQLPRPKGRGAPRAVGHTQPTQPPSQPEMRLPRQPAQAAAMAQQRHQQLQQNHVVAGPPQVQVAGLGRGQVKGQRKMAANLWGGAQPQSQHHQPEGHGQEIQGQIQGHLQGAPPARGHAASNAQASPPRPGGLGHSSWANQAAHNGPSNNSYADDFPTLGAAPQPQPVPLGLGRGLGRGSILTNPAPGMQY